ncbi:UNC93-like protein 2 [Smittium culicis]|uniref:UNC93-like protein 2 n=1 Tax=Smittium culicis TaxID=133412 RepID=A0A1R1Y0Y1_9FUNG|nr:UNC93-like protein 2 [Smittium culicis]OMJ12826.1 UNC93-like protein 2 [Smittium culicis]OMJ20601.1 UNC93-like protein 2 [Smittium culicis]
MQVSLIGIICFCLPGMYNALNSMGGGGQVDSSTASKANTAVYATFALFGIIGAAIINQFNIRLSMFASGLTFALYTASYVYYNNTQKSFFTIISGAILGVGAGILWTGQGMIMTSYPLEKEKGKFISIFWVIFSFGGVIGSAVPLIVGLGDKPLPNSGYIAFVAIQILGSFLCFALVSPKNVVKSDGSPVETGGKINIKQETIQLIKLFKNKTMIVFIPIMFASNFYNSYIFNIYNLSNFTSDSRGFNNLIFYLCEIVGAISISKLLDMKTSRRKRAFSSSILAYSLVNLLWILIFFQQRKFDKLKKDPNFSLYNYKSTGSSYIYPCFLYAALGIMDSVFQSYAYWTIGSLSNNSTVLSRYVGFFKLIQGIGSSVSYAIDASGVAPKTQFIINWALYVSMLPCMLYLCSKTVETFEVDPKQKDDL